MSLLSVQDVSVRFGGITALDRVGFDLNRGEILGLIGPNGAGKTTLFNCISGVIQPDAGTILFEGRPLGTLKPHERAQAGIARTFQNLQLWPSMTVLENLKLPIDALGRRSIVADALRLPFAVHAERRAQELARATLHALNLLPYSEVLAGDLPVGIQRRVEVARALCLRPRLLLLDEPAAGLDAQETLQFADLLHRIRERFKVSVLLVDHDMSLVMRACDYIYVLDFGRLLASGTPEQVRNNPQVIAAYLGEASEKLETEARADGSDIPVAAAAAAGKSTAPADGGTAATLLEVSGLAAGYGHLEVIRDVNLTVRRGEVVACIGANGAGKTTTLRAISGMIRPTRGRIVFDGKEVTHAAAQEIVRLGLLHVPQGRGLFARLTVEETLRLASYSGHRGGSLKPAYETFPVLQKRRRQLVGSLSGGEQQMLALARALLVRPKLLMIDEMSQGLAPTIVQRLLSYIEVFKSEGTAVLLVEQFVDSALSIADRAYVFEQGSIAHEESARRLRQDKTLIASSYLGAAASETAVASGNGHVASTDLMEELILRLPAALMRALQEQAAKQDRRPEELLLEFIQGQEVEAR